ncbi:hypothetical protein BC832DRAFT_390194 [Gaertneriomyces semiglobifer]|nr:hypothetical protein BC832DRAFT_390194 [Gaertneriomyces semiglobifer]
MQIGVACTITIQNLISWQSTFKRKWTRTSLLVAITSVDIFFEAGLQLFMSGRYDSADKVVITIDSILWIIMLQGVAWLTRDRLSIFGSSESAYTFEKRFVQLSPFLILAAQVPDFITYHTSLHDYTPFTTYFPAAIACTITITVQEIISGLLIIKNIRSYRVSNEKAGVKARGAAKLSDNQGEEKIYQIIWAIGIVTALDIVIIVMNIIQDFGMSLVIKPVAYSLRISFLLALFTLAQKHANTKYTDLTMPNPATQAPYCDTKGTAEVRASNVMGRSGAEATA